MDSQILLFTSIVALSLYLVGAAYSLYQYVKTHKRNLETLRGIFSKGVDVRKFPLFIGAAMLVRSLFFVIQYYYVSTEVDWYGLFMINCLEGIGYLLFITSYTTLVTFFAVLSNVVGGNRDGSFKRQQSHHSLRRQQRYEGTERKNVSQKEISDDHSPDAHLKTTLCVLR